MSVVAVPQCSADSAPAMEDLQQILHCLKSMPEPPKDVNVWVRDLRSLISNILHSPPNRLEDNYRNVTFELVRELFMMFGPKWLEEEQKLLSLIAHLVTAQLRIVLDNPAKIDSEQLTVCCSIEENCIRSIEDEDSMTVDDETATKVSITCREAAVFVTEYWVQAKAKDTEEELPIEVECVLYRFICVFLSIGGAQIMNSNDLKAVCPHLIRICWMAVERDDFEVARLLISVIHDLPALDTSVLPLLVDFIKHSGDQKKDATGEVEVVVEILKDRADWYDVESLKEARDFAKLEELTVLTDLLAEV